MHQNGNKYMCYPRRPPTPTPTLGVKRSQFDFLEHNYVAYQIEGDHECSNMVANIFPEDLPPPRPWRSKG